MAQKKTLPIDPKIGKAWKELTVEELLVTYPVKEHTVLQEAVFRKALKEMRPSIIKKIPKEAWICNKSAFMAITMALWSGHGNKVPDAIWSSLTVEDCLKPSRQDTSLSILRTLVLNKKHHAQFNKLSPTTKQSIPLEGGWIYGSDPSKSLINSCVKSPCSDAWQLVFSSDVFPPWRRDGEEDIYLLFVHLMNNGLSLTSPVGGAVEKRVHELVSEMRKYQTMEKLRPKTPKFKL
jgi:hypothetical protein